MSKSRLVRRTPVACGAVGRFDPEIVDAVAGELEPELTVAHRDESSILLLDRPPLRWRRGITRGFAWSEGTASGSRVRSWQDAACELNAAGFVVGPKRRVVHSSVAGVAPVYHVDHDGATYFASRIDPLVRALPMRFSIDWDAWASTLCLTHAVEGRTPFAEVRRLLPYSLLERRNGIARVSSPPWPWAEVEPDMDIEPGAELVLERLREVAEGLPPHPLTSLLSGGWDSRLVACLLVDGRPRDVRALTLGLPHGRGWEAPMAASVAEALAVPHEVVIPDGGDYWGRWTGQARAQEYQAATPLFLAPLAARLRAEPGLVADGFAIDAIVQAGGRFYTREMLAPDGTPATVRMLWRSLHSHLMGKSFSRMYEGDLRRGLEARSMTGFRRATKRVRGHPAEASLGLYLTRSVHGIATLPQVLLGRNCALVAPFTDHRVVSAVIRLTPDAKWGSQLHRALIGALSPAVAELPSTNDPTPELIELRNRERRLVEYGGLAPDAIREYERCLAAGPLAAHLSRPFREALQRQTLGELVSARRPHQALLTALLLHLWHERYRDRLRPVDVRDLLA